LLCAEVEIVVLREVERFEGLLFPEDSRRFPKIPADFADFADFRRFRRFPQITQIYADYADGGDNCHFGMVNYFVTLFYATDSDLSYGVYAFPFRDRVA
jgi:hypothetical protein